MNWMKIATIALGVGSVVAGLLIPGAQAILVPVGTGLVGVAIRSPFDAGK